MLKLFGWIIRVVVIIIAINLIIHIFNILGLGDFFGESFKNYEENGGSVFIEGPDALDPLDNNEPIFGTGSTTGSESPIQAPDTTVNGI